MKPKYVEVGGNRYPINTDFRIALECNNIALDDSIDDTERSLAIIFKLFGEEALNDYEHYADLLDLALEYLSCGEEVKNGNKEEPNMDFSQDMKYIEASFRSDYGIDINNENMHYWTFMTLLQGFTENSVLSRVRYIRDFDINEIKDPKEREKIIKQKESVALKKKKKEATKEQKDSHDKFLRQAGIRR